MKKLFFAISLLLSCSIASAQVSTLITAARNYNNANITNNHNQAVTPLKVNIAIGKVLDALHALDSTTAAAGNTCSIDSLYTKPGMDTRLYVTKCGVEYFIVLPGASGTKDSSAIHTVTQLDFNNIIFCDLRGRCDTLRGTADSTDGIKAGGIITKIDSTHTAVSAAFYIKNGKLYHSPDTVLVHPMRTDTARYDIILGDTLNRVVLKPGDPGDNPALPSADAPSQILFGFVHISNAFTVVINGSGVWGTSGTDIFNINTGKVQVASKLQVGTFTLNPGLTGSIITNGTVVASGGVNVYPTGYQGIGTLYCGLYGISSHALRIMAGNAEVNRFTYVGSNNSGAYSTIFANFQNATSNATGNCQALRITGAVYGVGVNNSIGYTYLEIDPEYGQSTFGSGPLRGIWYHPTITSLNTSVHWFIDAVSGRIRLGGLAGTGNRPLKVKSDGELFANNEVYSAVKIVSSDYAVTDNDHIISLANASGGLSYEISLYEAGGVGKNGREIIVLSGADVNYTITDVSLKDEYGTDIPSAQFQNYTKLIYVESGDYWQIVGPRTRVMFRAGNESAGGNFQLYAGADYVYSGTMETEWSLNPTTPVLFGETYSIRVFNKSEENLTINGTIYDGGPVSSIVIAPGRGKTFIPDGSHYCAF